ncbi:MAG: MreB/Mrl family cell shape determining protein [Candidatus Moranbacteria bacterium]|nr:MreB/Mrl family cell shape determining protein [Candidatus Moranbacteria bacterium]
MGRFSHDIGIDLGTANTLVYVRGKGIVINEPSVVALNTKTGQILAIGNEAKKMVGKTPAHIVANRPLSDGVISDFEVTEQMLKHFINKVHKGSFTLVPRPRVVVGIPSGVTEVEKRAVQEATKNAGAREAYLIEEPMAAAIGARLPIQEASGNMIVDIGGGTTEIAVISLGAVVVSKSLRVAGDELNEDIVNYSRERFGLILGEKTAEDVKIAIGSVFEQPEKLVMTVRGRDLVTGLPKEVNMSDYNIREAMGRSVNMLVSNIKSTIEETPPELVSEIMQTGIILAGGGGLLRGLDQFVKRQAEIKVKVIEDPLTAVVRGIGIVLEDIDTLKDVLVENDYDKAPRW